MSIIPIITPRQILLLLLKAGLKIIGQKGSHIRLKHPVTGKQTTVAMHAKDLSRSLITTILKQAGISIQEFLRLLGK
ncbi:MAG: type II toxin-antitoxin system HicA family toxin [bacterium]|nr:type II toxin-antitoxin system HicA family toxin [bacterium]